MSNQGKTDKQVEDSEKIASLGIVGLFIIMVLLVVNSLIF